MNKIKPCYIEEIKRVSEKTINTKGEFKFAVIADTHLDNSLPNTICNIQNVDKAVNYRCLAHLGDFLNGNIPRKYTAEILKSQMEDFVEATAAKAFYPAPGNHDGFVDRIKHNANDMTINEDWYEATNFTENYENVTRPKNRQYFYADYPEEKIRLIIINSYHYTGFDDGENFHKVYGIDKEQIKWVEESALNLDKDWTVMLFSHDMPFSNIPEEKIAEENKIVNGNLLLDTVVNARAKNGFEIAGWFIGHHHGDLLRRVRDINFILVGCATAYVAQLWALPFNGTKPQRTLNTATEDLWDSVILNKTEKKLTLVRFGAGEDREVNY